MMDVDMHEDAEEPREHFLGNKEVVLWERHACKRGCEITVKSVWSCSCSAGWCMELFLVLCSIMLRRSASWLV